jgi:hypothetical protein
MEHPAETERDWAYLLTLLPENYEETARTTGAFQRRRGVDSPATLLRLALAYAADASSLRTVAARARVQGLATLSDVALLNRLRAAAPWLGRLLTDLLAQAAPLPTTVLGAWRVRLQDATTVSRPGSRGTDWRLHLGFDLRTLTMDHVEVTDARGGETLQRAAVEPGEVWIADRGYAHRPGIAACVAAGGHVVVRLNWLSVPLQQPDGTPFDLLAALEGLQDAEYGDFPVQTAPDPAHQLPAITGRVVAIRKSPAQAEAARRRVQQTARRKGRTPEARTLVAAGYFFLFTTLPVSVAAAAVLGLYRFRWQVELAFKRLKSLLALDELTAKDPALCRAFLFGKLLLAILTERLCRPGGSFSPWGYGLPLPARGGALAVDAGSVDDAATDDCAAVDTGAVVRVGGTVRALPGGSPPAANFPSYPSIDHRATPFSRSGCRLS